MGILGFLFGLGCLVVVAGAIALLSGLIFSRKRKQRRRTSERWSQSEPPKASHNPTEQGRSRETSAPSLQRSQVLPPKRAMVAKRTAEGIALVPPSVSIRIRRRISKHERYIEQANLVLEQLRSGEVQLPKALGILRQMNPYAFEELLLTCCHERGWDIERNFKYTGDGGLDGRVTIAGKLYLIQAKRYRGYIEVKHIHDFHRVIQGQEAVGGFFIHTGKTSELSKELLRDYRISLLSGQRLVDFVLGQKLKIL